MKKIALWAISIALYATACAQQNPGAVKYAGLISPEFAKAQLSIIAADDMEGRETGQPGAEKAANYLAGEYKKLGLQPANKGSYFLDVPLTQVAFKVDQFTINGKKLISGTDFYNANQACAPTTANDNQVVFIGYGTTAEITINVTGKIVLLIGADKPLKDGSTPAANSSRGKMSPARVKIIADLQAKSPKMILSVNPNFATAAKRPRKATGKLALKGDEEAIQDDPATAVVFNINTAIADNLLQSTGKTFAQLKQAIDNGVPQTQTAKANVTAAYGSYNKDVKAVDIVACIPGSDPKLKNEVLVFSAHYDHIGLNTTGPDKINNGADDDGSGTTGILAIARAFMAAKNDGHGPRRTLLFLGNVGEEEGLLGSEYYTDHPVFSLASTIADLNIDMIGRIGYDYQHSRDSVNYIYPIGSAMLSTTLHKINEEANRTYTHLKLDYKYDDINDPNRFYYRSDHYNFAKHGVPIIFYFNGVHDDYHQPGDEVSKINFPLLAKRAQLVFFTGWELANRNMRPVVDVKAAKD